MTEFPPYTNPGFHISDTTPMLERADEVTELTADLVRFGSIAVASEVEADFAVGNESQEPQLPNIVTERDLKKRILLDMSSPTLTEIFSRDVYDWASDSERSVKSAVEDLKVLSDSGSPKDVRSFLAQRTRNLGSELSGFNSSRGNVEMILADADLPPFLKQQVDSMGWSDWIRTASREQITNFGQWYTTRLRELTNPAERQEHIQEIHYDYIERVEKAMKEGWIDPRHRQSLVKAMKNTHITFFSPFGNVAGMHFGGARQDVFGYRKDQIYLPTTVTPGSHLSTHELGHSFAGVHTKRASKVLIKTLGKKHIEQNLDVATGYGELLTIINEGFNDHMAFALREGQPAIISPRARREAGLDPDQATSSVYEQYREAFAALVNGDSGEPLLVEDIKELTDTMIERDFQHFCDFVKERWDGRDVMKEIIIGLDTEFSKGVTQRLGGVEAVNKVLTVMKRVLIKGYGKTEDETKQAA